MKKRAIAIAALTVGLSGLVSAPAAQAETNAAVREAGQTTAAELIYWRIRHEASGGCLTAWSTGAVRIRPCSTSERSQQWHWINSSWNGEYRLLANRWTGTCLRRTDQKVNPSYSDDVVVNTGSCEDWTSRHWRRTSGNPALIYSGSWHIKSPTEDQVIAYWTGAGATVPTSGWWTFHAAN